MLYQNIIHIVTLENFENKNGLANVATLYQGAKSYNDMFYK